MALRLLVRCGVGSFVAAVSAPCRIWLCEDGVAGREAMVCELDGGGLWDVEGA